MAQRALREYDSKTLLKRWLQSYTAGAHTGPQRFLQVRAPRSAAQILHDHPDEVEAGDAAGARKRSSSSAAKEDVATTPTAAATATAAGAGAGAGAGAAATPPPPPPASSSSSSSASAATNAGADIVSGNRFGRLADAAAAPQNEWLKDPAVRLVVKPDQLIKRRGKGGLLLLNASYAEAEAWIDARMHSQVNVEGVNGILTHFLVEPFVKHKQEDEYYVSITSDRAGEHILFHHEGGVDIGDVDAKALVLDAGIGGEVTHEQALNLVRNLPAERREGVATFVRGLLKMYRDLHFCLLEINPLVMQADGSVLPLDVAAKIDETAEFLCHHKWGSLEFPPPFGRQPWPEEAFIHELDSTTGASLKLTLLNKSGRVWTMVAGGGASVVYADTISDLGFGGELANYGEYSGAPTEELTYQYAQTILRLMTAEPHKSGKGKVLIVGGGIANFTDVAKTFKGIIRALRKFQAQLKAVGATVWVRRGGPNYQTGLQLMRDTGTDIGVPIHVYGPDTHITAIVPMALGMSVDPELLGAYEINSAIDTSAGEPDAKKKRPSAGGAGGGAGAAAAAATTSAPVTGSTKAPPAASAEEAAAVATATKADEGEVGANTLFSPKTRAIVHGMQLRAVQGMLDFDFLCKRAAPSVAAIIFPFAGNHYQKFYYGGNEVLIPVFQNMAEALKKHSDVTVLVNFASFRSAYSVTVEALNLPQLRTIAIIAEGIPEQLSRDLVKRAEATGVMLIGPATVGGLAPGCFRIGNTGGMLDNIVASKLYRPGSVAYVSKSGGMSNELNNIIIRNADGIVEGVAIGGDRYPGSRFIDHLLRYQANPKVKMMVLLGEVGGVDEYDVCKALQDGRITKPLVAWCIGTCAKMFPFEVQFGHAGALANSARQTADAKNTGLAKAGAIVPSNFNDFAKCIRTTYLALIKDGTISVTKEPPMPKIPMDYAWAKSLGIVRKPSSFVSSISDERGDELMYAGMPISQVFSDDIGVGGVLCLLWFKRRLPAYATKFIEMVLMVTADHGPAVSGAHNTIVAARAGKDLVSSLVSGLLTIGPRFGGALDEAAVQFSAAVDKRKSPAEFVEHMRRQHKLIMGIGHKVKSLQNPDKRVTIVTQYAKLNFPSTTVLDYAMEVEKITTKKKANLILNVDGAIAVALVDLLRSCGAFTKEEADEHIVNGCLNGLFVLGRSIGFIGHFLDQRRLKQGLYRHPWDDISYISPNL